MPCRWRCVAHSMQLSHLGMGVGMGMGMGMWRGVASAGDSSLLAQTISTERRCEAGMVVERRVRAAASACDVAVAALNFGAVAPPPS